jgi:hypothetical protein
MPQFPYLVSDLLYDIVETVNCKFSRILTDSRILTATSLFFPPLQGGFDPCKKSGVGVDFELLVRCLLLENKVEARKPSMIFR